MLGSSLAPQVLVERRITERHSCNREVELILEDEPVVRRVQAFDISHRGIGFRFNRPLERGTQFLLELRYGKGHVLRLHCSVAYARPVSDTEFAIGAEYFCLLERFHEFF